MAREEKDINLFVIKQYKEIECVLMREIKVNFFILYVRRLFHTNLHNIFFQTSLIFIYVFYELKKFQGKF